MTIARPCHEALDEACSPRVWQRQALPGAGQPASPRSSRVSLAPSLLKTVRGVAGPIGLGNVSTWGAVEAARRPIEPLCSSVHPGIPAQRVGPYAFPRYCTSRRRGRWPGSTEVRGYPARSSCHQRPREPGLALVREGLASPGSEMPRAPLNYPMAREKPVRTASTRLVTVDV